MAQSSIPSPDYRESLNDIVGRPSDPSTRPRRIAKKIVAVCDSEFVAGLDGVEFYHLLTWMGGLKDHSVARKLQRKILSHPEPLSREALMSFVTAPMQFPALLFDGPRQGLFDPRLEEANAPAAPSDAIANFAVKALRGFKIALKPGDRYCSDYGETRKELLRCFPETLISQVRDDSVCELQLLADIRMEPMPIALMLYEGGQECLRLLMREETYEMCEVGREALATLAVIGLDCGLALYLLQGMEAETPGYLRTVRDAAGHNLLWYLAFRKRINIKAFRQNGASCRNDGASMRAIRDYLLKKAKCDPNERDAFGLSWMDVREALNLWGIASAW